MTLVELLIATTVMAFIAMATGIMATSVRTTAVYNQDRLTMMQHARVSLDRIERVFREARLAKGHPGAVVVYELNGSLRYPDTLIVWRPNGSPANPAGPPLISECLFYCPDPAQPHRLVELSAPTDMRVIPFDAATLNTTSWRTTINQIKSASSSQKVVLTDLLRIANPRNQTSRRGAARFDVVMNPSASEIAAHTAGSVNWSNMAWPTMLYGSKHGLQQVRLKIELQIARPDQAGSVDNAGHECLPFYGSFARYQLLTP